MSSSDHSYVPAAGHHWGLPLYDPMLRLFGLDRLREPLIQGVAAAAGARLLDVGCGTGTLAVALKRAYPDASVVGVDPDPKALAIARDKARAQGVQVEFVQGFADRVERADGSIDQVVSSFMFHHLDAPTKGAMLREVRRLLVPGGRFHLLDFLDRPRHKSRLMRALHAFGGHAGLRGQVQSDLAPLLVEHGLAVLAVERKPLLWMGEVGYYVGQKSTSDA